MRRAHQQLSAFGELPGAYAHEKARCGGAERALRSILADRFGVYEPLTLTPFGAHDGAVGALPLGDDNAASATALLDEAIPRRQGS